MVSCSFRPQPRIAPVPSGPCARCAAVDASLRFCGCGLASNAWFWTHFVGHRTRACIGCPVLDAFHRMPDECLRRIHGSGRDFDSRSMADAWNLRVWMRFRYTTHPQHFKTAVQRGALFGDASRTVDYRHELREMCGSGRTFGSRSGVGTQDLRFWMRFAL